MLSSKAKEIFEKVIRELEAYKELIFQKPALIAYSGGKDSSLLLNFYLYLFDFYKIPLPGVFHLNHCIRDNKVQEIEIGDFLIRNYPFTTFLKKKIFLFYPNTIKKAWKKRDVFAAIV